MKVMKSLMLFSLAVLMMGNKSCEKQQASTAPKARTLKKIVDVGLITSQLIDLPGGQKFDFQYVLNQQIYPVLQKNENFWFRYEPFFSDPQMSDLNSNANSINVSNMNVSQPDQRLVQKLLASEKPGPSLVFSDEISCLINFPQFKLWGSVNSFELVSKIGLGIGFTPFGTSTSSGLPGINFDVQVFQLDMNMTATPAMTKTSVASTNVTSKQTKTNVDVTLPLQILSLEPSFYFQTPLAKVSYNALEKAANDIASQLSNKEWYTRVLFDHDKWVTILAGSNHNVKVGDTFDIYNERVYWQDPSGQQAVPCESEMVDSFNGPIVATIEIDEVGDDIAKGKIVYETGEPRKMGARVKIRKLVDAVVSPSIDPSLNPAPNLQTSN